MNENKRRKVDLYQSQQPSNYPVAENLRLEQLVSKTHGIYELSLNITLRNRSESDSRRLELSFSKVRNFRFNPEQSEISFSILSIVPLDDGWEDVNFKVFNDEQDVEFSFLCDDFTTNLIG